MNARLEQPLTGERDAEQQRRSGLPTRLPVRRWRGSRAFSATRPALKSFIEPLPIPEQAVAVLKTVVADRIPAVARLILDSAPKKR